MTFNYAGLRDRVVEPKIANFGRAATLKQPGAAAGDAWNPTNGTPTEYAVQVLSTKFTYTERQGSLVEENDQMFLMSTDNDPDPGLNGVLVVGSTTYQVIKLTPLSPGAVTLLWRVHCRK